MLVVEENYAFGVPLSTVTGWAPPGAAWHWSAGGAGRTGWEGTIRHLINTRGTVNASYHGGMWCEHAANHAGCRTILQWIVPTTKAAHSISPSSSWQYNPNKPRTLQDIRFTEVRRILGAKATDPNAGCIAIAYAGMPADLERDLACPAFRADVQDLARQLVAHPAVIDRPHFGHGWIQPISRYEMDVPATDFIALLYAATATPIQEDDMQYWKPVEELWDVFNGTQFWDGSGIAKTFTSAERVKSIAESSDGKYRLVKYGQVELLVLDRWTRTRPAAVPGSRIPTTGYGFATETVEVPTGITREEVAKAGRDGFYLGRDQGVAAYTAGGTAAANEVTPS